MTNGINVIGSGNPSSLIGTGGDDSFTGTDAAEFFFTGMGNDRVFAGNGMDHVYADLGNDWLEGSLGIDTIDFRAINYINPSTYVLNEHGFTFDMNKTTPQKMGYLGTKSIFGFEDVRAGNGNDKIYGSNFDNKIEGFDGSDFLDGRGGNDTLEADSGRDTLIGGKGADVLASFLVGLIGSGDNARDMFVYKAVSDSGLTAATRDTIWGYFNGGGSNADKIDLSALDANGSASGNGTFKFIGTANFHSNSTGEVQVRATSNANEYAVRIDADNDTAAELMIIVHSASALVKGDFVL